MPCVNCVSRPVCPLARVPRHLQEGVAQRRAVRDESAAAATTRRHQGELDAVQDALLAARGRALREGEGDHAARNSEHAPIIGAHKSLIGTRLDETRFRA